MRGQRDYNKILLLGNLAKDPEIKNTPSGKDLVVLNLATTLKRKKNSEKSQDKTDYHKITLWGSQAKIALEYLKKGDRIFIEGYLSSSHWEDKKGAFRKTWEIIAEKLILLSPKSKENKG